MPRGNFPKLDAANQCGQVMAENDLSKLIWNGQEAKTTTLLTNFCKLRRCLFRREENCRVGMEMAERVFNIPSVVSPQHFASPDLDELSGASPAVTSSRIEHQEHWPENRSIVHCALKSKRPSEVVSFCRSKERASLRKKSNRAVHSNSHPHN